MPQFLPFARLKNPDGGCSQLDNCQVLGYLRKYRSSEFETFSCDDCCPSCVGDIDDYTGPANSPILDGAWWADPLDPSSDDAQGFLIEDIYLEPTSSVRRAGETGEETTEYTPRRLEITGTLLASTLPALARLRNSLFRLFGSIDDRQLYELELLAFCPADVPVPPAPEFFWVPDPLPPLDPVTGDPCTDSDPCARQAAGFIPQLLGPAPAAAGAYDRGTRRLLQIRFVSLDTLDTTEATRICEGERVQIVLEVLTEELFGEVVEVDCPDVAAGGHPWGELPPDLTDWRCRPYNFRRPKGTPLGGLCPVDPLTSSPAGLEGTRPLTPFLSAPTAVTRPAYCDPMFRQVRACLSPVMPTPDDLMLSFNIGTGPDAVRNFSVKVYPAFEDQPSPETCEGEAIYELMRPCAAYFVPWIPPNSSMLIDGPGRQVRLSCGTGPSERADDRVDTLASGLEFPRLAGGCYYWIVLTADCFNITPDVTTSIAFTPVTVAA